MSNDPSFTADSFGSLETPSQAKWNELWANDESLAAGSSWMTGAIIEYAAAAAPTGWLLCNGQSVSRSTYSALFALIGTTYGSADGSHFNVPDLRTRVAVGYDPATSPFNALGNAGGEVNHTLVDSEIPSHTHTINDPGHGHSINDPGHNHSFNKNVGVVNNVNYTGTGFNPISNDVNNVGINGNTTGITVNTSLTGITTGNVGSDGAHNNMQPYLVVNKIIKF